MFGRREGTGAENVGSSQTGERKGRRIVSFYPPPKKNATRRYWGTSFRKGSHAKGQTRIYLGV